MSAQGVDERMINVHSYYYYKVLRSFLTLNVTLANTSFLNVFDVGRILPILGTCTL